MGGRGAYEIRREWEENTICHFSQYRQEFNEKLLMNRILRQINAFLSLDYALISYSNRTGHFWNFPGFLRL